MVFLGQANHTPHPQQLCIPQTVEGSKDSASWEIAGSSYETADTMHTLSPALFPTLKLSEVLDRTQVCLGTWLPV